MTENREVIVSGHGIWVRGLFMLLMGMLIQVAGTVLCVVAVIQFILVLVNKTPNPHLLAFGRSLGRYMQQIVYFLTFTTEEIPFPFSEWPSAS